MKLSFKGGPSTGKKRTAEAEKKRKKSLTATMEARRKEKGAWYCQSEGTKHYANEEKFVICKECFRKLKELNDK